MADDYDLVPAADHDPQPWETEIETSKSGQPVHRYEARTRDFELAIGDMTLIEAVEKHIESHFGGETTVLHEIMSDLVHVDVHIVHPTDDRPYFTLITSGMSQRPMTQPTGVEGCQFAELMICLPPDWPGLDSELMTDDPDHPWQKEKHYWPIGTLKFLARFPHEFDTWIWWGHTIPNGDPPEPFAENTNMVGVLLLEPVTMPESFHTLRVGDRDVNFFAIVPLHEDEMQLKLDEGTEALLPYFNAAKMSELLDVGRPSAIPQERQKRKRWWWWPF